MDTPMPDDAISQLAAKVSLAGATGQARSHSTPAGQPRSMLVPVAEIPQLK